MTAQLMQGNRASALGARFPVHQERSRRGREMTDPLHQLALARMGGQSTQGLDIGLDTGTAGGIVATKPYVSSANYIHKMSDYCQRCRYDLRKRHGDGACPFNSLFWYFLKRHQKKLKNNPRIGMMYRTWHRKNPKDQRRILKQAQSYKQDLNRL